MASSAIAKRALTASELHRPPPALPSDGPPNRPPPHHPYTDEPEPWRLVTRWRLQPPHGRHTGRTTRRHGAGASVRRNSGIPHTKRRSGRGANDACRAATWRFSSWEQPSSELSIIKGGPKEPPHANRFITENAPVGQG